MTLIIIILIIILISYSANCVMIYIYTYIYSNDCYISWTISCLWSNITMLYMEVYTYNSFISKILVYKKVKKVTRNIQPCKTYLYRKIINVGRSCFVRMLKKKPKNKKQFTHATVIFPFCVRSSGLEYAYILHIFRASYLNNFELTFTASLAPRR